MEEFAHKLGCMVAKKQMSRAGRLAKTPEARKRELDEAGSTEHTGLSFKYPKGKKVK